MRQTEQFVQLCYLLSCPTNYFSFICCWLFTHHWLPAGWLGSRVVSVLDSGAEGPGFKSQSGNSLRQTVHNHCASVHQAAKLVAALLRVAGVTAGLVESNRLPPTAGFMTHITCRLTAKNRDQLRKPTLCNRLLATFLLVTRALTGRCSAISRSGWWTLQHYCRICPCPMTEVPGLRTVRLSLY